MLTRRVNSWPRALISASTEAKVDEMWMLSIVLYRAGYSISHTLHTEASIF